MPNDSQPDDDLPISLIGAGLTGTMLALYLARRGYSVQAYELREDWREADFAGGRSINLALSTRGLNALAELGLEDRARKMCIPMHGRMIHAPDGTLNFQPYGQEGQHINSVSRAELNRMLLDAADAHPEVEFFFRHKCRDIDLEQTAPKLENIETGEMSEPRSKLVVGADGAYSSVRNRLQKTGRFDYEQDFLSHGYKELTIPPRSDGAPEERWRLHKNALHIWPRHDFMLIALPNPDGSFTCTLFLPFEGPSSFEQLQTPEDAEAFFAEHFPDALEMMPHLGEEFSENPTSSMVTIRCEPYHHDENVVLVGDAAHAVVPFYGQGMNASFEDCFILDQLIDEFDHDWSKILPAFSQRRKPDADAIADLALYNYYEMRSKVADPGFLMRQKVERALNRFFPDQWKPLYSMVTFSNIPYAEALQRARQQEKVLDAVLPEDTLNLVHGLKERIFG